MHGAIEGVMCSNTSHVHAKHTTIPVLVREWLEQTARAEKPDISLGDEVAVPRDTAYDQ